jgi:hypothetical protein
MHAIPHQRPEGSGPVTPGPASARRSERFRTATFPPAAFQAAALDVLRGALPAQLDLKPLRGLSFRVTTFEEPGPRGSSRTLVLTGTDAHVWLIVHHGEVFEQRHTLGALELRAALSQRPDGALIVGTAALQCCLLAGEDARVFDGDDEYVVHHAARSGAGASYVIADARLWRA